MLTAWAVLIAVEEGVVGLEDAVGQPGCTLRHLLAHAGGYPFDGPDPDRPASPAAHLLEHGHRARRRRRRGAHDDPFRRLPRRGRARAARDVALRADRFAGPCRPQHGRRLRAVPRRAAAADVAGVLDGRRRSSPAVSGAGRYRAGRGAFRSVPVGAGLRDPWPQVAALDWSPQQRGHVRALRRGRHDDLGRPAGRRGARRADGPRVRRLVGRGHEVLAGRCRTPWWPSLRRLPS